MKGYSLKNARFCLGHVLAIMLVVLPLQISCEQVPTDETPVGPYSGQSPEPAQSEAEWNLATFEDATKSLIQLTPEQMLVGGPQDSLNMTFAQANSPIATFNSRQDVESSENEPSVIPYISFFHEKGAAVTLRHIKSIGGQIVSSQVVVATSCPQHLESAEPEGSYVEVQASCLPLINAVVRDFLVSSDSGKSFVHSFQVNIKNLNETTRVLETQLTTSISIPESDASTEVSAQLRSLMLRDRMLVHTNDLRSSPRRDFPLFELKGELPPGVETAWVLDFSEAKLVIEEQIFFEQPVLAGPEPSNPTVARGAQFFRRSVSINSDEHFRMRLIDGYDADNQFDINLKDGAGRLEVPITRGDDPLWFIFSADFASEKATKTMGEYVRPLGPVFCQRQLARYKPEQWRQLSERPGYVACEALSRQEVLSQDDATAKELSSPIETFFGSFNYMPRLSASILGGMNGVFSYRVSLQGLVTISVVDPDDPTNLVVVSKADLTNSFKLPSVIEEFDLLVLHGGASPGLDGLRSALVRKGFSDLPEPLSMFPFLGLQSKELIY